MRQTARAVFFDAGQTLLRPADSVGAIYARVASTHGVTAGPEPLNVAFRAAFAEHRKDLFTASSEEQEHRCWRRIVASTFESVLHCDAFGGAFDGFVADLYRTFADPGTWRVFDDVRPLLTHLADAGIRTAVVSNWDSRLPALLEALGLRASFEFVLTSAEAGASKPNPRIFEMALNRLGMQAREVLHVGDSHEEDILGAQAAGIAALQICRDGVATPGMPGVIRSLEELDPRRVPVFG